MRRDCFSPPLGKSLNIIEKIEGLLLADTSFARRDSRRPVKKKSPCHPLPSTSHGGHYDSKYSLFASILRAVFVGERARVFHLNQPVKTKGKTIESSSEKGESRVCVHPT